MYLGPIFRNNHIPTVEKCRSNPNFVESFRGDESFAEATALFAHRRYAQSMASTSMIGSVINAPNITTNATHVRTVSRALGVVGPFYSPPVVS